MWLKKQIEKKIDDIYFDMNVELIHNKSYIKAREEHSKCKHGQYEISRDKFNAIEEKIRSDIFKHERDDVIAFKTAIKMLDLKDMIENMLKFIDDKDFITFFALKEKLEDTKKGLDKLEKDFEIIINK